MSGSPWTRSSPRALGSLASCCGDCATAHRRCCFYAATDPRITGVVLVNPWVRTQVGEARTYLRHYYVRRFFSRAFWRKLVGGEVDLRQTVSVAPGRVDAGLQWTPYGAGGPGAGRRRLGPAASRADGAEVRALPRARAGDPER